MFSTAQLGAKLGQLPAACHVEPAVSSFFSSRTQSDHPIFARWYRVDTPKTPPPIITTRAVVGEISHVLGLSLVWDVRGIIRYGIIIAAIGGIDVLTSAHPCR